MSTTAAVPLPVLLGVLVVGLVLSGCAAPPRVEPDPEATEGRIQPAVRWEPIEARQLMPLEARFARVRVVEGPDEGEVLEQRLEASDGQRWTLTVEDRQRMHLGYDEQGHIVVFQEDDFEQSVAVHYEPALVLVPARLEADTNHRQQVEVTVRQLEGEGVRDRGTATHRIEAVRFGTVETDMGVQEAYLLRQHRQLALNFARAEVQIDTLYVPDVGRIAWRVDQSTRIMGVIGSQQSEGFELLAP